MTDQAELDKRRANVRALELLDASHRAYERGDKAESRRLSDEADAAAPETSAAVRGAMLSGFVPHPDSEPGMWADYIQAQRDGLARAEAAQQKAGLTKEPR